MVATILHHKIIRLQHLSEMLLCSSGPQGYGGDLSTLQRDIHGLLEELSSCHGRSMEEEATLCLSLLLGYSVSWYASPSDEARYRKVLQRSRHVSSQLPPSPLKEKLDEAYARLA